MQRHLSTFLMFIGIMFSFVSCAPTKEAYQESGIANLIQLTTDPSYELDPCWSADGKKILFSSSRGGALELWMMSPEGGGIQQITMSARSADRSPDLSPDQSMVVFQSTRVTGRSNIWKLSLGNRGLTQLTNNPNGAYGPRWSPDGSKILYSARDKDENTYVWIMGAEGENPTQLGPGTDPYWSPDGRVIVYARQTKKDNYDIWIMKADGTDARQLTSEPEKQEIAPVFSKDGKSLAYVVQYKLGDYFSTSSEGNVEYVQDLRSEIWIMDADGQRKTQLTAFKGLNTYPAFAPDGRIAFVSSRGDSWDLWLMIPARRNEGIATSRHVEDNVERPPTSTQRVAPPPAPKIEVPVDKRKRVEIVLTDGARMVVYLIAESDDSYFVSTNIDPKTPPSRVFKSIVASIK